MGKYTMALSALLLGLTTLAPEVTRASNEDDFFVGNHAAMAAGAVTATVDDGSAAYYNPAGLGGASRGRLDVSASAYALRSYSAPGFLQASSGESASASVTEFVAIPTAISYVRVLSERAVLGLGYYVPKAEESLLREKLAASDLGLDSDWGLDLRVSSKDFFLAAALGLRATKNLRLGFGLYGIYGTSVESATIFGAVQRNGAPEKALQLSTLGTYSRIALEAGFGIQVDLPEGFVLGASARGPQVQLARSGDESITGAFVAPLPDGSLGLVTPNEDVSDEYDQLGLLTLGRYRFALAYGLAGGTLSAEFDVQPGLRRYKTDTDRVFTWNARLGAMFPVDEGVTLGGGLFTDRATDAPPAPGDFASRVDFYGATAGVQIDTELGLAADEDAETLTLVTVFALRYAYGSGPSEGIKVDPNADIDSLFSATPGTLRVHEIGLHVGSALTF